VSDLKLQIVDGSIDDLIICAMAQIGGRATIDEITKEIHSYNDGKAVERALIESALYALSTMMAGNSARSMSLFSTMVSVTR
jgi:hypothetical protein